MSAVALTETDGRGIIVSPKSQIQIDKCVRGSMVEHATLKSEAVMSHITLLIPPHREAISNGTPRWSFTACITRHKQKTGAGFGSTTQGAGVLKV